jgi:hypothetical protein
MRYNSIIKKCSSDIIFNFNCTFKTVYLTVSQNVVTLVGKWIEAAQSIIITGSRQQAGRQEGLGVWGLRMHVGSALRSRSEARSVPPPPVGHTKEKLQA